MDDGAQVARSVVMRAYGLPDVLAVEQRPTPRLRPGEVRVRVLAAAVNHSDLEIRSGTWPVRRAVPFPYVPGLEAVGEVVEVADPPSALATPSAPAGAAAAPAAPAVGDRVWTMMQGLGGVRAERDGGYAEYVVVAADAVAPLPGSLDPVTAAAVGLAGVTAAEGLRRLLPGTAPGDSGPLPRLAQLAGRRVAVTGAAGGVGSLAVGLAAAAGAEVTAVARRAGQAEYLHGLGATRVLDGRQSPLPLPPGSVDGVLDMVAGPLFAGLVSGLAAGGRYCLVGAVAGSAVAFDAWSMEGRVLTSWSSEDLNGPGLRTSTRELVDALDGGRLPAPACTVLPLAEAARAHALLEAHQVTGRVILIP